MVWILLVVLLGLQNLNWYSSCALESCYYSCSWNWMDSCLLGLRIWILIIMCVLETRFFSAWVAKSGFLYNSCLRLDSCLLVLWNLDSYNSCSWDQMDSCLLGQVLIIHALETRFLSAWVENLDRSSLAYLKAKVPCLQFVSKLHNRPTGFLRPDDPETILLLESQIWFLNVFLQIFSLNFLFWFWIRSAWVESLQFLLCVSFIIVQKVSAKSVTLANCSNKSGKISARKHRNPIWACSTKRVRVPHHLYEEV
jgi:hypothetical protein